MRDGLLTLAATLPALRECSAPRGAVDSVGHPDWRLKPQAWGGNPEKDALYLNVVPAENGNGNSGLQAQRQGRSGRRLLVDQRLQCEGLILSSTLENAYTLNNIAAKANADGSVPVFPVRRGCDSCNVLNCLPITPGWNYLVRLYRPRAECFGWTLDLPGSETGRAERPAIWPRKLRTSASTTRILALMQAPLRSRSADPEVRGNRSANEQTRRAALDRPCGLRSPWRRHTGSDHDDVGSRLPQLLRTSPRW